MKLKNILLVVSSIEKSKAFYEELFGMQVLVDFGKNIILTEGLVLQERELWESAVEREVRLDGCDAELYFEESNLDAFLQRLEQSEWEVEYLSKCGKNDWGRRIVRIYDPDRHVIEIGEPAQQD